VCYDGLHMPDSDISRLTMAELLRAQAARRPQAEALLAPGLQPLTYAHLWEQVQSIDASLRGFGVPRGARIAIVLPDGSHAAAAQAAVSCYFIACPLHPLLHQPEYESLLASLRVVAVMVPAGDPSPAREAAAALRLFVFELAPQGGEAGIFRLAGKTAGHPAPAAGDPQPGDVAFVFRTSGTTSEPKKVPLTHRNVLASARNLAHSWGLRPGDRNLSLRALSHQGGFLGGPLVSWWAGAAAVCTAGFQPALFREWMATFDPVCYSAVPAVHRAILAGIRDGGRLPPGRLRWIYSGAASLPAELMRELEDALGAAVVEGYGLTETATHTFCNPQPPQARKARSVGKSLGAEIMIAGDTIADEHGDPLPPGQTGEVLLRGESVMSGYEDSPDADREVFSNGWFRTGDLGYLDADGYLFITGRKKETINRGGEKISPLEVEEALRAHDAVADAACFAVPDARLGEEIAAAVVLRAGCEVSERDLRRFVAGRKSDFATPARIYFLDTLPRNAGGKVMRRELSARFAAAEKGAERPGFVAPRNEAERRMAAIWQEVLPGVTPGIHDDFFEIGGNSLLAVDLTVRIQKGFGRKLPLVALIQNPTIEKLVACVTQEVTFQHIRVIELQSGTSAPFFCVPGAGGLAMSLRELATYFKGRMPFCAFETPRAEEVDAETYTIPLFAADLVAALKRQRPAGPYDLGGFCWGALVALEMAQQLRAAGDEVRTLILLDTVIPGKVGLAGALEQEIRRRKEELPRAPLGRKVKLLYSLFRDFERKVRAPLGLVRVRRQPAPLTEEEEIAYYGNDAVRDMHTRIAAQYQPVPYAGAMTVMLDAQNIPRENEARSQVCRQWAAGEFREVIVPGAERGAWTHAPGVQHLANALLETLESARATEQTAPESPASAAPRNMAPRNMAERKVSAIWQEVLRGPARGVHDNFFDVGGNSLLAADVTARIERAFGRKLPLAALILHPTIEELAACVTQESAFQGKRLIELQTGTSTPFFCVPGWGGQALGLRELAICFKDRMPFCAFDAPSAEEVDVETHSIPLLAAAYASELKQRQPQGPYDIGGVCWGTLVALEMAQQLRAAGDEVRTLVLLDPDPFPIGFARALDEDMHHRWEEIPSVPLSRKIKLLYGLFRDAERKVRGSLGLVRVRRRPKLLHHLTQEQTIAYYGGDAESALRDKILAKYQPVPYPGPITVMLAGENVSNENQARRRAYQAWIGGEFNELVISGVGHGTWTRAPEAQVLANMLLETLESARLRHHR